MAEPSNRTPSAAKIPDPDGFRQSPPGAMSETAAQGRAERIAQARMRAQSAAGHFASSSGRALAEDTRCERCNAPLNRWDQPCKPEMSTAGLLAQDVFWLLDQLEAK